MVQGRAGGGEERERGSQAIEVRHRAAQMKLYVLLTEPRVQSSAACWPVQGRIFLLATTSHGETMPLRPRLGFAVRRRKGALLHLASAAGKDQSRNPARAVMWALMWTQGSRRRCWVRAESHWRAQIPGQGCNGVNSLPIACRVGRWDYCFDAYVEAHMDMMFKTQGPVRRR